VGGGDAFVAETGADGLLEEFGFVAVVRGL
jgi:hypothetical protein